VLVVTRHYVDKISSAGHMNAKCSTGGQKTIVGNANSKSDIKGELSTFLENRNIQLKVGNA